MSTRSVYKDFPDGQRVPVSEVLSSICVGIVRASSDLRQLANRSHITWLAMLAVVLFSTRFWGQSCPAAIIQSNRDATVLIQVKKTHKVTGQIETRTSTGFVISPSGWVLTNKHVIDNDANVDEIQISGSIASREAPASRLLFIQSNEHDVALLKFADTSKVYKSVALGSAKDVDVGTHLCSEGFPADKEYFFAEGPMSGTGAERGFWLTQMPSNPGDSGAPAFLISGRVVAIKVGGYEGLQNVNLLIPVNLAKDLLELVPDLGGGGPEREKISLFLKHMCKRGVLSNRWSWEIRKEVFTSITGILKETSDLLDSVSADSSSNRPLVEIQKASRIVIQDPSIFPDKERTSPSLPIDEKIGKAIDNYRIQVATALEELEETYNLEPLCDPSALMPSVSELIYALVAREAQLAADKSREEDKVNEYGDLFADDATMEDVEQHQVWRGKNAIQDRFRKLQQFNMLSHQIISTSIQVEHGAATAETMTVLELSTPGPNEKVFNRGTDFWSFVKVGGKWKIGSFRYNLPPS